MRYIIKFFQILYCIYAYLLFFGFLFVGFFYTLIFTLLLGKKAHVPNFIYYKFWAISWFFLTGVRLQIIGKEYRDSAGSCIITCNHSTHIDLMNGPYMLPLRTKALAKIEIRKIPLLGYQFKAVSVFVDRGNKESRESSIQSLKDVLNAGFSIFLYPEGTRNRTEMPLKDFYDGAFRIAISTQKPVLPVCIINGRGVFPLHTMLMRPGKMKAIYLPPIPTTGMTEDDVGRLKQLVYRNMYDCIVMNDPKFRHLQLVNSM